MYSTESVKNKIFIEFVTVIIRNNNIQSVTTLRMEVPCCEVFRLRRKTHCRPAAKEVADYFGTLSGKSK